MMARAAGRCSGLVGGAAAPRARAGVARGRPAYRRSACSRWSPPRATRSSGSAHGFAGIRSVAEYQERVPLRDYGGLPAALGARGVGRARRDVAGRGPALGQDLRHHRRRQAHPGDPGGAGRASAGRLGRPPARGGARRRGAPAGRAHAVPRRQHRPPSRWASAGSWATSPGSTVRRLPPVLRGRYAPGAAAAIPDWETRIETIARQAAGQDIRLLAGMPSWMLVLFERVARARQRRAGPSATCSTAGRTSGSSSTAASRSVPTRASSRSGWGGRSSGSRCIPPPRAGSGIQTEARDGLTLTLDHGNFYEFVPGGGPRRARGRAATPSPTSSSAGPTRWRCPRRAGSGRTCSATPCASPPAIPLRLRIIGRIPPLRERVRRERHRRGGGARARRPPAAARRPRWWSSRWRRAIPAGRRAPREPRLAGRVPRAAPRAGGVRPGARRDARRAQHRLPHQALARRGHGGAPRARAHRRAPSTGGCARRASSATSTRSRG